MLSQAALSAAAIGLNAQKYTQWSSERLGFLGVQSDRRRPAMPADLRHTGPIFGVISAIELLCGLCVLGG
jgi:hypothetical protein